MIDRLGSDALRFFLLREVQWDQDRNITWEGLNRRYEGKLANDLGNLVSRATAMITQDTGTGPFRPAETRSTRCTSRWPSGSRRST